MNPAHLYTVCVDLNKSIVYVVFSPRRSLLCSRAWLNVFIAKMFFVLANHCIKCARRGRIWGSVHFVRQFLAQFAEASDRS